MPPRRGGLDRRELDLARSRLGVVRNRRNASAFGGVAVSMKPKLIALVAIGACGLLTQFACGGVAENDGAAGPSTIRVAWGERTCPGPYADGPYAAQDIFFGQGKANVPLPPVFLPSNDAGVVTVGWPRTDLSLAGTPEGNGQHIVSCGVAVEQVTRVTATAPLAIEREFTWTGTRTEPCNTLPTPPPSGCHVVQQIVYPMDVPSDAGP